MSNHIAQIPKDDFDIITVAFHAITGRHIINVYTRPEIEYAAGRADFDIVGTLRRLTACSFMEAALQYDKAGQKLGMW